MGHWLFLKSTCVTGTPLSRASGFGTGGVWPGNKCSLLGSGYRRAGKGNGVKGVECKVQNIYSVYRPKRLGHLLKYTF